MASGFDWKPAGGTISKPRCVAVFVDFGSWLGDILDAERVFRMAPVTWRFHKTKFAITRPRR